LTGRRYTSAFACGIIGANSYSKLAPPDFLIYFIGALMAAGVIIVGRLWARRTYAKQIDSPLHSEAENPKLQENKQGG
jgi:hypothetical protein